MRPDLILEARAFVNGAFDDVEIAIDQDQGTILAVKKQIPGSPRRRHRGHLLVPSGVDLHVHMRDPGDPKKEDFRSGTRAAALGGVGTVFDMPNTKPLVDRYDRLADKRDLVARKACVDWGLWATMTAQTRDAPRLLAAANGVKLYLAPTTGIDQSPSPQSVAAHLEAARAAQRLVALHAEAPADRVPQDLASHDASRPPASEVQAITAVGSLARPGTEIHVAHATTAAAVQAAHAAGFSAAATPHHLLLSHDAHPALGTWGRVNPPLRQERERAALWLAWAAGDVPLVETDHAPHARDEKLRPFAEAPSGLPGVETAYPLLLRAARDRRVDPARVVHAYSDGPASRMGIRKGRIAAGFDADFFLFDPRRESKVRAGDLATLCQWTPFEDWPTYRVATHYLHGDLVVEDGQFIGRPGHGRPLAPVDASSAAGAWRGFLARARPAPAGPAVAPPQRGPPEPA